MGLILRHFSITALLLFHGGAARAHAQPNSCYQFSTRKYRIEMGVSFPAPYEGRRLAVYRSSDPGKEVCLSINQGPSACTENFVGALAFVTFLVKRSADGKSAAASIRERVTLMGQSPGMPDRPPFAMSVRLINGAGTDVQVDDSLHPKKRPRAFVNPIDAPGDVRLSVKPVGGLDDYWTLFHEAGHAVFDMLDVPVFGREEDAGKLLWRTFERHPSIQLYERLRQRVQVRI